MDVLVGRVSFNSQLLFRTIILNEPPSLSIVILYLGFREGALCVLSKGCYEPISRHV